MSDVVELKLLAAAVVIGLVQLAWAAVAARRQQNLKWAAGPRDTPMPITGVAARLDRAFRNFQETFPLFATAVLAAVLMGKTGELTLWGAGLYVACRAIYVPIYAAGIPRIRSLVWAISLVGLILVIVALFR
ncbi:MAPEG family protein [Phenylobacterium sp.]|jgi:uncharacterized MAPEG superfamily protein|uniref:MAPEG family protein n=1 Tax=Phenylobacterium sp. TaxID=1871053 RepID=UPI0037844350